MAIHRFLRKAMMQVQRRRHAAPRLPETTGLSGTARRVNRVVAVVALFGAFGTVALAVALTPGAQTPASSATVPQEDFKISRIVVPPAPAPAPVEAASLNTTVVVVQPPPEPAPKADRLFSTLRAPENRNEQSPATTEEGQSGGRDVALADMPEPTAAREAAESAGRKLDEDVGRSLEFGLSEPPAPGEIKDAAVDDAALDEIEDAIEAAVDETPDEAVEDAAIDEIAEEPVEEKVEEAVESSPAPAAPEPAAPEPAAPEVAAIRTAPVTTDVNMRARPENGAAVIQVVPGKSTVEVIGCNYWCEVVYEGRRGFIYKGFVRGS